MEILLWLEWGGKARGVTTNGRKRRTENNNGLVQHQRQQIFNGTFRSPLLLPPPLSQFNSYRFRFNFTYCIRFSVFFSVQFLFLRNRFITNVIQELCWEYYELSFDVIKYAIGGFNRWDLLHLNRVRNAGKSSGKRVGNDGIDQLIAANCWLCWLFIAIMLECWVQRWLASR